MGYRNWKFDKQLKRVLRLWWNDPRYALSENAEQRIRERVFSEVYRAKKKQEAPEEAARQKAQAIVDEIRAKQAARYQDPGPKPAIPPEWLACRVDADCGYAKTAHGYTHVNRKYIEAMSQLDPVSPTRATLPKMNQSGRKYGCIEGVCSDFEGPYPPGRGLRRRLFVLEGSQPEKSAVSFINETEWIWQHDGIEESGTYVLNGDGSLTVVVGIGNGREITGRYDADSGRLIWNNAPHRLVTEDDKSD